MKQLYGKLWVKCTAIALLVVFAVLFAAAALGSAYLIRYGAFADGGEQVRQMAENNLLQQTRGDGWTAMHAWAEDDTVTGDLLRERYDPLTSNIYFKLTDKDTGETTQPPELKYVEVLAATQSSGADKEYQAPAGNEEEENPEETLPATITLLVNSEQAQLLAHLEESNSLHLAFVYRGTRANAEKFLAAQDAFFAEPEAGSNDEGSQPEVPVDSADGGQPAEGMEEQEVETTDGE